MSLARLPSGYTEVEYIESSGAQWIDTGVVPTSASVIEADVETLTLPSSSNAWLFGADYSVTGRRYDFPYIAASGVFRFYYGGSYQAFSGVSGGRLAISIDTNKASVNGVSVTLTAASFTGAGNLFLCTSGSAKSAEEASAMRIYAFRLSDGDTLLRDFVPCTAESGEAGLYDLVGGSFYANAGNGAFTAGAVVLHVPDMPANLTAAVSKSAAVLGWDASEGAIGYRIRRCGVLLADTADTAYMDKSAVMYAGYSYAVTAYNADGESEAAVVSAVIPGSADVLADLITDRTQADVTAKNKKGVYNAADLNRCASAAAYVGGMLGEYGYAVLPAPRNDRAVNELVRRSDLQAHLDAVRSLDVIAYSAAPVTLPLTMEKLTHENANAIERFLLGCGRAAERIPSAWLYCGEPVCGSI